MNITTTCTDRKKMAKGMAEFLGCDCVYLFTPTYAFRVGDRLHVERDGSITGERADLEAVAGWLLENGYISEPLPAEEPPEQQEGEHQATDEQPTEDQPEQLPDADSCTHDDAEVSRTRVSVLLNEFTPTSLTNLLRILYARQRLICEMTQSDCLAIAREAIDALQSPDVNSMEIQERVLRENIDRGFIRGIELADGQLGIDFAYDAQQPIRHLYFAELLTAIVCKAKMAKRVSATLIEPDDDEMKYFCRSFIVQLGLGSPAHKQLRDALLGHLHGYAAFRTTQKMDAHKQKYAELRRQRREADLQAQSEVNEDA